MVTKEERWKGTDMYTLLYLKQITNRDLMHSKQNSTQYTKITQMGKEFEKEEIYIHTYI